MLRIHATLLSLVTLLFVSELAKADVIFEPSYRVTSSATLAVEYRGGANVSFSGALTGTSALVGSPPEFSVPGSDIWRLSGFSPFETVGGVTIPLTFGGFTLQNFQQGSTSFAQIFMTLVRPDGTPLPGMYFLGFSMTGLFSPEVVRTEGPTRFFSESRNLGTSPATATFMTQPVEEVPEPSTALLMALGAGFVSYFRRRGLRSCQRRMPPPRGDTPCASLIVHGEVLDASEVKWISLF